MTEVQASTSQLTGEEYDAALARLRTWANQIVNAEVEADRDSLDRAADLVAVYESKLWVRELPPVKKLAKRKARRDTQREFARWTRLYPEKIGRAYSQPRVCQLLNAVRVAPLVDNQVINNGERALRAIAGKFANEHPDEIPDVIKRAREIADGAPLTAAIISRALRDHNNFVRPPIKRDAAPVIKDKHAEEKRIRAEFNRLLEQGRRKDAGELINLLIADYKAGTA